jgi:hypothetical protein
MRPHCLLILDLRIYAYNIQAGRKFFKHTAGKAFHIQRRWNLNSTALDEGFFFKFIRPLNAFTTVWCAKAGRL